MRGLGLRGFLFCRASGFWLSFLATCTLLSVAPASVIQALHNSPQERSPLPSCQELRSQLDGRRRPARYEPGSGRLRHLRAYVPLELRI